MTKIKGNIESSKRKMVHHMQGNKSPINSWLLIKNSWGQKAVGWNPNCIHLLYLEAVSSATVSFNLGSLGCAIFCLVCRGPWEWMLKLLHCVSIYCCSVAQSCPTSCSPMDCSMPSFPVHHHLLELAQIHVYWVSDAIQPSHPLSSPSPLVWNLSQHKGIF